MQPAAGENCAGGTVIDLSEGGAGVLVDSPIEPFSVMVVKLMVDTAPVPVPVLAQVRWMEPPSGGRIRMGLLFVT